MDIEKSVDERPAGMLIYDYMLSWRIKRQLTLLLTVALVIGGIGFLIFYRFMPEATCFDDKKNQEEQDIDCGGPCIPCALKNPREISTFWVKFAKFSSGSFDTVAYLKNPNELLGASEVSYEFELLDQIGAVVALRRGKTFFLPGEDFYIVESNLMTSREPVFANFKITNIKWVFGEFKRPDMIVGERNLKKTDENGLKTVLETSVQNRSIFDFGIVEIGVLIFDESENLLGIQKSIEKNVLAGEKRSIDFFWPGDFNGRVTVVRVEPRVNILVKENILRR